MQANIVDNPGLRLAEQMPSALRELLDGLQSSPKGNEAAQAARAGDMHRALVTTLLRLLFLFYAEAHDLVALKDSPSRLLESLCDGHAEPADALSRRSDAWRALVKGFDEVRARYEPLGSDGRLFGDSWHFFKQAELSDARVYRLLTKLACIVDDEGIAHPVAFDSLPIELLGTFYEAMMGFEVEELREPSLLLCTRKAGALPVDHIIGLPTLLTLSGRERLGYLEKHGVSLSKRTARKIEDATSPIELAEAWDARAHGITGPLPGGTLVLRRTESRRRSGSHYTSPELSERAVNAALEPVFRELGANPLPLRILELKICDPAMGSGAFLLATCRVLGDKLVSAWERHGKPTLPEGQDLRPHARRLLAERCLYGVDKDPFAVELARLSLWLLARAHPHPFTFLDHALRHGDSLVDIPLGRLDKLEPADVARPFQWERELKGVFARENAAGFDAIVGNPPWISYAGRAAQPLEPSVRAYFAGRYEAFAGYRNLQGLFIERSAQLLRPGGRLGLVLPSSMSEQEGYEPTRLAHDRLCQVDDELPDLGEDCFPGVFQPCMILLSTRRGETIADIEPRPWPVERADLDALARAILAKMNRPPLPASLFGERGLQTMASDVRGMTEAPTARHTVALRVGSDIAPFLRRPASLYADPARLGGRLRPNEGFANVRLLIRQTARMPMVALSDGGAFRNSILAGFEDEEYPAGFLVAYLNSSPIRWLHYMRFRDARQGMPQVKIGHLRATPRPPNEAVVAAISRFGAALSEENDGIDECSQRAIDNLVADAFDLSKDERERIFAFAAAHR